MPASIPSLFNVYRSTAVPSGIVPSALFVTSPCPAIAVVMLSSITFSHPIVIFPLPIPSRQLIRGHLSPQNCLHSSDPRHYTSTPAPPRNSDKMDLEPIKFKPRKTVSIKSRISLLLLLSLCALSPSIATAASPADHWV